MVIACCVGWGSHLGVCGAIKSYLNTKASLYRGNERGSYLYRDYQRSG